MPSPPSPSPLDPRDPAAWRAGLPDGTAPPMAADRLVALLAALIAGDRLAWAERVALADEVVRLKRREVETGRASRAD